MNKSILLIFVLFILAIPSFSANVNPLQEYIGDDIFREAEKKFEEKKNFFESKTQNTENKSGGTATVKNDLNSIFIKVDTIIRKDRKWGCIVFYKERDAYTDVVTKRKVILGNTIIKVSGVKYFLSPYESGIEIREIITGNTIHLKVQEGR